MKLLKLFVAIPLAFARGTRNTRSSAEICISPSNTFTVVLDLYASELGYYTFEECGSMVNPTIGMEVGETYTFIQSDRSNWYHPLGFAYFPDGAHDGVDELEPGVNPPGSRVECASSLTCPAPMYFLNGEYLGAYSNIPEVAPATRVEEDFGLDAYEPLFFHPLTEWLEYGEFSVKLRFDDQHYGQDIFYFCHIHQFMTGRIKLLRGGSPISPQDNPPLGYTYDEPGPFDRECGTFGLDAFQLPHPECPSEFVCSSDTNFAQCIDAMNCHMMIGMTTGHSTSDIALFVHQMIPHHQNAVNMAKTLLIRDEIQCDDLTNEDDPVCAMEAILRDIVNTQNAQIQGMRKILESLSLPPEDDCKVTMDSMTHGQVSGFIQDGTISSSHAGNTGYYDDDFSYEKPLGGKGVTNHHFIIHHEEEKVHNHHFIIHEDDWDDDDSDDDDSDECDDD